MSDTFREYKTPNFMLCAFAIVAGAISKDVVKWNKDAPSILLLELDALYMHPVRPPIRRKLRMPFRRPRNTPFGTTTPD